MGDGEPFTEKLEMIKRAFSVLGLTALAVSMGQSGSAWGASPTSITGAGATFPYPLYSKWFAEYKKANPSVEINYQSIGSGGGIRQLLDKTVDFGASDAPMTDEQLAKSSIPVLHIPTVLGAVAITYNIPEVKSSLKLTSDVVADIFLGKITQWNDKRIQDLNPGVALPQDTAIMVTHRSDGSGTTAVFTDYLAKVSQEWKEKVGSGTSVKWPTGLGGKGNEGVTGLLKQTPGTIGYVELTYAVSNKLPVAQVKNAAGTFITPSPKTVTAAASGALKTMPADFRVSITQSPGKDAYPISSFTYLLVYQKMAAPKGPALVQFLNWAMADGQKIAEPLDYAPLPKEMIQKVKAKIGEIKSE